MDQGNEWYRGMSGKGSKPRPYSVSKAQFDENWDKIFRKESPKMLHEVNYDNMWQHSCTVEMAVMWIGKNETCNWCGAWEEDGL